MRKKKTERQNLIEKLDNRQREILFRDFGKECVMCGSTMQVGVGHVFSRKHYSTRWDTFEGGNAYPQCWKHNFAHVRDQYPYFKWFRDKYGDEEFERLRVRHVQITNFKKHDLERMLEEMV